MGGESSARKELKQALVGGVIYDPLVACRSAMPVAGKGRGAKNMILLVTRESLFISQCVSIRPEHSPVSHAALMRHPDKSYRSHACPLL